MSRFWDRVFQKQGWGTSFRSFLKGTVYYRVVFKDFPMDLNHFAFSEECCEVVCSATDPQNPHQRYFCSFHQNARDFSLLCTSNKSQALSSWSCTWPFPVHVPSTGDDFEGFILLSNILILFCFKCLFQTTS